MSTAEQSFVPSKSRSISRRFLVRNASVAGALLASTSQISGQPPTSDPDIDQIYSPTLDTDEVMQYIADATKTTPLDGPAPTLADLEVTGNRKPLPRSADNVRLVAATVETYRISKGGKLVGTVDVTVPVTEILTMSVFNHLLIRKTVTEPARSAIIAAWEGYDWTSTPDPLAYAREKMANQGVTRDMFAVRQSYRLTKQPNSRTSSTEQRDALLALYGQSIAPATLRKDSRGRTVADGTLDLIGRDAKLPDQLKRDGYRLDLINTAAVGRMPAKVTDPVHQLVGKLSDTPNVIDIITTEMKGLDCTIGKNPIQKRIATVFAYPEFKLTWELYRIRLGCVTVVLTLPVLWLRLAGIVLWAYVGNPTNILQHMISQVEGCAINAVLTGALIGIVLSNFAAALATFRVVFIDCVSSIPANIARCLAPGLVLLTESDGDWTRMY